MRARTTWAWIALVLLPLLLPARAVAQEDPAEIPLAELQSDVAEMDAAALEALAQELQATIEQALADVSATEVDLGAATEEQKEDLQARLTSQKGRVNAVAARYLVVIRALKRAGGDVDAHQETYFDATGDVSQLGAGAALGVAQKWLGEAKIYLIEEGPGLIVKFVVFLLILLVAKIVASLAGGISRRTLSTSRLKTSELLRAFAVNIVSKTIFFLGVLMGVAYLGVPIGPFLAGIGVLGFVVGFALQDTLSNFAAGVMLLVYRPYDVGDFVTAGGITGTVRAMTLVSTTLVTPDNQVHIVPNGSIWGDVITNVTANPTRRVDLEIGIGYGDDIEKAERVMMEEVKAHPKVLAEPAPVVRLAGLGESSVDFNVRPWSKTTDYWDVYWDLLRSIKLRFDREGISIPFPQRDVHIVSNGGAGGGAEG